MQAHITFTLNGFIDKNSYPYHKTLTTQEQKDWEELNRTLIIWTGCLNFPLYTKISQIQEALVSEWLQTKATQIVKSFLETGRELDYENDLGIHLEKEHIQLQTFNFITEDGETIDGIFDKENIIIKHVDIEHVSVNQES